MFHFNFSHRRTQKVFNLAGQTALLVVYSQGAVCAYVCVLEDYTMFFIQMKSQLSNYIKIPITEYTQEGSLENMRTPQKSVAQSEIHTNTFVIDRGNKSASDMK